MVTIVKIIPYRRTPQRFFGIVEDETGLASDYARLTQEQWARCPLYYLATPTGVGRRVKLIEEVWADFDDYLPGHALGAAAIGLVAQVGSAPDS